MGAGCFDADGVEAVVCVDDDDADGVDADGVVEVVCFGVGGVDADGVVEAGGGGCFSVSVGTYIFGLI